MKRIFVHLRPETHQKLKAAAEEAGVPMGELLDKLLSEYTGEPTHHVIQSDVIQDNPTQEEFGICPFCYSKKPQIVTLVTFRDNDMVRAEGKICDKHITLAKQAGSFVGYGGLAENS